jgi:clan AA aspartic protease (TIGR02281 family)
MSLFSAGRISGLVTALAIFQAAGAATQTPDDVLKSRGLKRSGSSYVLSGEAEVQRKMREAQLLSQQLTQASMQQMALEQDEQVRKEEIAQLTEERLELNNQLAAAEPGLGVAQHNQLVARINALSDAIRTLQARSPDPELKRQASAAVRQRRGSFIDAVLNLRQLADQTNQKYSALAKDESIGQALRDLGARSKTAFKLGPSSAFKRNIELLSAVEKRVLTDKIELRPRGGVYELDVTFAGKVTVPLYFDTGASYTTLSAELAARIGLSPHPSDPLVRISTADGSSFEAKLATIPSVRVGKFVLNDVACVILPPDKKDAPLLLGQSFLNAFEFKVTPDSHLILSKVAAADAKPKAPDRTKKAKKSRARAKPGARATVQGSGGNWGDSF